MSWSIDKQFSLCYGHRVWTQQLDSEYTADGDCSCKCRHLHGHEGLLHVFLEADELTNGMVTDFKHLGWFKDFVDDVLDHKFIIDKNDPMFKQMVCDTYVQGCRVEHNNMSVEWFQNNCLIDVRVPGTNFITGQIVDKSWIPENTPTHEVLEGFFVVDFVPTSENLSQWAYNVVNSKMSKLGIKTKEIWWNETPKSRSIYRP